MTEQDTEFVPEGAKEFVATEVTSEVPETEKDENQDTSSEIYRNSLEALSKMTANDSENKYSRFRPMARVRELLSTESKEDVWSGSGFNAEYANYNMESLVYRLAKAEENITYDIGKESLRDIKNALAQLERAKSKAENAVKIIDEITPVLVALQEQLLVVQQKNAKQIEEDDRIFRERLFGKK